MQEMSGKREEAAMKETGIIMTDDHPAKILAGTKTMTRRTNGLDKINESPDRYSKPMVYQGVTGSWLAWFSDNKSRIPAVFKCPYGGVGDRLWVRATWSKNFKGQMLFKYQYEELVEMFRPDDRPDWLPALPPWPKLKWKPSIHLLKEDAEIWLEITGVRVERLQDISHDDARNEGVDAFRDMRFATALGGITVSPAVLNFRELWDSLNAKRGSWDDNPWVWVIEFRKID